MNPKDKEDQPNKPLKTSSKGLKPVSEVSPFSSLFAFRLLCTHSAHKLPLNFFVYENIPFNDEGEVAGLLSIHNQFKKIQSVTVDPIFEIVSAKVDNFPNQNANIEALIKNLQSLGDSDAFNLAFSLKRFEALLGKQGKNRVTENFNVKKLRENEECQLFHSRNLELMSRHAKTPFLTWRMVSLNGYENIEIVEIGFNFKFIDFVAEHRSNFVNFLIKKGLPDCIQTQESYFKFINLMMNKTFIPSKIKENELKCFLTSSSLPKVPARLHFETCSFQTENYHEVFVLDVFEVDRRASESFYKFKRELETAKTMMKNLKKKKRVLLDDRSIFYEKSAQFLRSFYPPVEIVGQLEESSQRCKFRELNRR